MRAILRVTLLCRIFIVFLDRLFTCQKVLTLYRFSDEADEVEPVYVTEIRLLRETDRTTIYINWKDLCSFDEELAEAIEIQFYRWICHNTHIDVIIHI